MDSKCLKKGLIRLWVALCVPVMIVSTYMAYDSYSDYMFWGDQTKHWMAKIAKGNEPGEISLLDPGERFDLSIANQYESKNNIIKYIWIDFGFPIGLAVILLGYVWVKDGFNAETNK